MAESKTKTAPAKAKADPFLAFVAEKQAYYNTVAKGGDQIRLHEEKHHPDAHMLGKTCAKCSMCDLSLPSFTEEYGSKK
jgi:hypothetical protein